MMLGLLNVNIAVDVNELRQDRIDLEWEMEQKHLNNPLRWLECVKYVLLIVLTGFTR